MNEGHLSHVQRFAAFTDNPDGGNPAGVVTDARGLSEAQMRAIATEVGYSETAFLVPDAGRPDEFDVRFFTPSTEVDFCGHATIAAGVALALARHGAESTWAENEESGNEDSEVAHAFNFHTKAGLVTVDVGQTSAGLAATLTSPPTSVNPLCDSLLDKLLETLDWDFDDLDVRFEPAIGWSGNAHPVLVAGSRHRLQRLDYDFDALARLCQRENWTTIQLVCPDDNDRMLRTWHSRNPAPGVGIDEDPATGSAAVALGAYLVNAGSAAPGDILTILQGEDMGRPSILLVTVGSSVMRVTGTAVEL